MRGNPLWQLALIVTVFLALGVPVWRLTRPAQAVAAMAANGTDNTTPPPPGPTTLEITTDFAPPPAEFSLGYLDQTVLQGKEQGVAAAAWKVRLPIEGADLVLHVAWPPGAGGGSAAARVTVKFPDGRTTEKSFWSPGAAILDTVVSVPGAAVTGIPQP